MFKSGGPWIKTIDHLDIPGLSSASLWSGPVTSHGQPSLAVVSPPSGIGQHCKTSTHWMGQTSYIKLFTFTSFNTNNTHTGAHNL